MKKFNVSILSGRLGISLISILFFFLVFPFNTYSNYKEKEKDKNKVQKVTGQNRITDDPFTTLLDVNNITLYVQPTGFHFNFYGGSWSSAFPKGTAGGIYQEGIVWGGLVNDGQSPQLRVGGNTYFSGTKELDRIYRVRPDYLTADLRDDAANFFYYQNYPLDASPVTDGDIQQLRNQYAKDWMEWPADKGAPFDDVDGDGVYNPDVDVPGIPGASQTIWIYYNDAIAPQAYGSPPIGIEVQQTFWAYAVTNPLSNVIFKKVNVVYKGTANTPSNATINDMYLVQWSDPDIGQYTDDFAGCDPSLNLGFAYSSSTNDAVYGDLGLAPAALGYDFLQGVAQYTGDPDDSAIVNLKWRKGYKYVNEKPLTVFTYFAAGGAWQDPDGQDPLGTPQWYNLMRGFLPRPEYPSSQPFPANVGGTAEGFGAYLLSGDPITRSGFVDGVAEGPGDRRIVNVTGPFNMTLNDTAEIVVALIGGIGSTNTSSVAVLKFNDIFAQYAYDQLFDLPSFPAPEVSLTNLDKKVVLNWDFNSINIESASPKGYTFQGYNVYQFPNSSFNIKEAVRVATYDIRDNITTIFDDQFDEASGLVLNLPAQFGTDAGIQRFIEVGTDAVRNQPLRNGQEYYFGISAYGYNPDLEGNLPFKALESSIVRISATPQMPTPGVTYGSGTGSEIVPDHSGTADGSPVITIVDPAKTTGHDYEVFFTDRQEIRNENGDWVPSSNIIRRSSGYYEPDTLVDVSVDIAAVYGPQAGTLELKCVLSYDAPDGNWVDGVLMIFPEGTVILSAPNFEAGNLESNYNGIIAPEIIGNIVMMGDSNQTGIGSFTGGEEWSIVITGTIPIDVNWIVYDDGWSGGTLNGEGITQVMEVGFSSRLAKYWNLKDVNTGDLKLVNRSEINGVDLFPKRNDIPTDLGLNAAPVVDGFQISMDVGYAAPIKPFGYSIQSDAGSVVRAGNAPHDTRTIIGDYTYFGVATSKVIDAFGYGTNDINKLQQDYEIRYTGILGDTVINGRNIRYVVSGGQMATLFGTVAGASNVANHPMNPSPGTNEPFLIRVPFEVWNKDTETQVNIMFRDREQDLAADPFQAWYPDNRNYINIVNTPYDPNKIMNASQPDRAEATWTLVIWSTRMVLGDVITVSYANPIQIGVDTYTFKTPLATSYSADLAKKDVEKINVFPNPYYGTHYREVTREGKYVTFSHLPAQATIRIFDLAGVLVRVIDKDDPSQFTTWNLQNNNNYPVASGIYIVHIEMPALGATKILKLAVIQEEQILRVY
jgi:hypothetical protein